MINHKFISAFFYHNISNLFFINTCMYVELILHSDIWRTQLLKLSEREKTCSSFKKKKMSSNNPDKSNIKISRVQGISHKITDLNSLYLSHSLYLPLLSLMPLTHFILYTTVYFFNLLFSLLICQRIYLYFTKISISILSFTGIPIEFRIFAIQLNECNICQYLFYINLYQI